MNRNKRWYLKNKDRLKEKLKTKYYTDIDYKRYQKIKACRKYVRDGKIELIENYEKADAANFEGWCIHHKLEVTLDGEYALSKKDLIRHDMYLNRPPYELIWMTKSDHMKLHSRINNNFTDYNRRKRDRAAR